MVMQGCVVVEMKETTTEQRATSRIDYWREQIAQQERSQLPVKEFCETHGITEQFGSSIIFNTTDTAALEACCRRAFGCEMAARRASRYASPNSGIFCQRSRVDTEIPAVRAASSTVR